MIELWAVEAFVFCLLLLFVLHKQLLCAFLSLLFLCGMMPFFVVGVLPMLEMQVSYLKYISQVYDLHIQTSQNYNGGTRENSWLRH
jgi:hypothetical protein